MLALEQEIYDTIADAIVIPNRDPLDVWCKSNVYLPSPPFKVSGQLDLSRSKYLVEPMLSLQNPEVHEVVCVGVPRSGKTLLSQGYLKYVINEEPSDILIGLHKAASIKSFSDARILPFLNANKVKFADELIGEKKAVTQRFIKFPVGCLKIIGAQNASDMAQLGFRVLIGDDIYEWKPGVLDQFKRRASEFRYTKKILLISQASEHGTDWHKEYLKTNQCVYGFKCPECGTDQVFHFTYKRPDGNYAGFRFDPIKNSKDEWDIPAAAATARYECINCLTKFHDPKDRHVLNDCGIYIPQNPNAPKDIRGYSWNALASENISYESIVTDFLHAKEDAARHRYEKSKNFHLQVLSNFFNYGLTDEKLELNVGEDVGADGPDGLRFLGVDTGKDFLHYVVLAFFKEKREIHLIAYDKIAKDWGALEKVQLDNRVSYKNVIIDSGGIDNTTQEVYRECANHFKIFIDPKTNRKRRQCWCASKGDEPKEGAYYHSEDKKYRLFSPIRKQEVVLADKISKSFCKFTLFATSPIRTTLQELIENKHPTWKLLFSPEAAADQTFKDHLQADKLVTVFSPRSNKHVQRWVNPDKLDNHFADALNLGILCGVMCNYL